MTYHHLSVLVHRQAEKYGDKIALKYRDYETAQWIPISWKEFSQTVRRTANAMVALGIEPQENIGIFSQNKPECLFTDFGAFANRAVTIPLYATSSPAQAQYIINDAQIRYLFVILISRAGVSTSTRNMPSTATSVWRRNIVRTVRHTPISLFR